MLNLSTLLAGNNLWTILINQFAKWIVSYGWAIVVFTIVLKIVLSPLDVLQRVAGQKQARVSAAMQPELDALQKKYGNNKEKLNQETNKVYKKYNTGMGGSCLIMLLSMVLNIVIVFSLFGSVRAYGNEKLYESYRELDSAYVQTYNAEIKKAGEDPTDGQIVEAKELATKSAVQKYEDMKKKNSWLWIKNVWKSDTKTSQFVDIEDYIKNEKIEGAEADAVKDRYGVITKAIDGEKVQPNGFYVLIILAVVVSFLTQLLSAKLLAPKGQKMSMMNKVMFGIIPITMFILAINSNCVYTLYILANSIMSAIISTIISLIFRKINKKYEGNEQLLLKKKNVEVVEYSRNYKK